MGPDLWDLGISESMMILRPDSLSFGIMRGKLAGIRSVDFRLAKPPLDSFWLDVLTQIAFDVNACVRRQGSRGGPWVIPS